jgi:hypothetical protein
MNHLNWGHVKIFGFEVIVDWAETQQEDRDNNIIEKVK